MKFDIQENFSSPKELNITSVLPVDSFHTQVDSSLSWGSRSSYSQQETNEPTATTNSYNSNNGYGLVNAGTAVSKAAGVSPYPDAPKLGGNNWGADMVNAPTAWQNGHTGQGIIVAVLDTGVDYNHEDLNDNIWTNTKEIAGNGIDDDGNGYIDDIQGWNFDNNNNNVLDNNGHGTHVSGTIAGENNGSGVTGVAFNSKIMAVKVLDQNGSGSYGNIANGIRYAVDNGADVINLSLGGNASNNTLKSAIEYAGNKGVIVVMAAGNDGGSTPSYPARYAYDSGIAVGAVNKSNQLTDFSNRSGSQEIKYVTAPGEDIYSTVPNNQYANYSGTSMAAPHVAGVVALMLSANPNLTEGQVRDIITSTAENDPNPQQPSQPSNPMPSLPFPFPIPIDLLPFGLIDIGSAFPIGFQAQSTIPLPPIVLSVGNNNLKLSFGDFGTKTPNLESLNQQNDDRLVSLVSQSLSRSYGSSVVKYSIASDGDIEEEELFKKR
ncbi:S8 family serine peptidase [Anabaena sphaerica FACHB-251]|uniref:S8 family serine peptidase n=1 Tax=Anabaena sphaerica FACHB-251 TaxID=2692883 RepID=A0A926WM75_9NOST|nr:S8 family peptidase [Anabaena sphaerica]MBD2295708.1 S8 family serine peptidase [Anabaena sphaerica FACHB-251]